MYDKKVIILNQLNDCYTLNGKSLCSMFKLICDGRHTQTSIFVNNADSTKLGEWFAVIKCNDKVFVNDLHTFNNCTFKLENDSLGSLSCLLAVRYEDTVTPVASGGQNSLTCLLALEEYLSCYDKTQDHSLPIDLMELNANTTQYEEFVDTTENFYSEEKPLDIEKLREKSEGKYETVKQYSSAFERYYASSTADNYYQVVKKEIAELFVAFPPYYPLIERFPESFFVRIDFPKSERFFALGVLLNDGYPQYICYALPGDRGDFADKDFVYVEGNPVGFWILYQDAATGQITVNKRDEAVAK